MRIESRLKKLVIILLSAIVGMSLLVGCSQNITTNEQAAVKMIDFNNILPKANILMVTDSSGTSIQVVEAQTTLPPLADPEIETDIKVSPSANTDSLTQPMQSSETKKPTTTEPGGDDNSAPTVADKGPVVLTIKGSGVSATTNWTLAELQALSDGYREKIYSAVSNWPTRKFFVGKGIDLNYLLKKAGITSEAASITVQASDGYYAKFTRDQLLGTSYYYPNLKSASASGASSVPAMLAWASKEGSNDLASAREGDLRLLVGQKSLNCVNTVAAVQKANLIEVSTSSAGSWAQPTATEGTGTDGGKQIILNHPQLDQVTIYYTTDGSTPNYNSQIYNPSTTYYQPDLIKPIAVQSGTTIKAVVFGFGKNDSGVATFQY